MRPRLKESNDCGQKNVAELFELFVRIPHFKSDAQIETNLLKSNPDGPRIFFCLTEQPQSCKSVENKLKETARVQTNKKTCKKEKYVCLRFVA